MSSTSQANLPAQSSTEDHHITGDTLVPTHRPVVPLLRICRMWNCYLNKGKKGSFVPRDLYKTYKPEYVTETTISQIELWISLTQTHDLPFHPLPILIDLCTEFVWSCFITTKKPHPKTKERKDGVKRKT